jgi:hypothetical protein
MIALVCCVFGFSLGSIYPAEYYDEAVTLNFRDKECTYNAEPANFQNIVDLSLPGDVICLQPDVIYPGLSISRDTGATEYTVIRIANLSLIPPAGVRVSPFYSQHLPKIEGQNSLSDNSDHIVFIGVEFSAQQDGVYGLIVDSTFSHHIIFDQCYFKESSGAQFKGSIFLQGGYLAVMNCFVEGGSFPPLTFSDVRVAKITNNYFVSDTQLLIFAPLSAITDVEIRLNSFIKSGS